MLYKFDENGNPIKIPTKRKSKFTNKEYDTYTYAQETITLQRAMWAWYNNVAKAGCVIDHKNNKRLSLEDYRLENLQEITPQVNVTKDKVKNEAELYSRYELPKKKKITLQEVEANINELEYLYEEAKFNKDAKAAHSLRGRLARQRGLLKKLTALSEEKDEKITSSEA